MKKITTAIAALVLGLAFSAHAGKYGMMDGKMMKDSRHYGVMDDIGGERDLFSIFDANNDGRISMEEVTMGMAKMVKMDKNADHFLTRDELVSRDDYSHFMARFDFNRDGMLEMSEIPMRMRAQMMRMDKDGDRMLTIEELTGEADTWTPRQ